MRVAAISTAQVPSSTANSIQVMKVCQALAQNGHSLRLLVPGSQAAPWEELARAYGLSQGFAVEWLRGDPRWKRNDFAWKAVRAASGVDWVYTWSFQAAVLARLSGTAALLEVHDLPTGRLGPLWLRAFLAMPGPKRLVVITRALRSALERRYGRLSGAIIAPNGVEPERYAGLPDAAAARQAIGLAEGMTVECSGHLYPGRGGDLFLALARRFPAARFVWVGGRPEDVAAHRRLAVEQGLENVTFCGHVPQSDIPLYQAAGDVLLMPYGRSIAGSGGGNSAEICSPMKLFDYLAAGRAILSSDLPVIREVIDEGCARFAPPEDENAWAAALAPLLADPGLRARLAARGRALAVEYSWTERERKCLPLAGA